MSFSINCLFLAVRMRLLDPFVLSFKIATAPVFLDCCGYSFDLCICENGLKLA